MTIKHFEELWNEAENLFKDLNSGTPVSSIIDELMAKLSVYKALDGNEKLLPEDKVKLKSHTFGKLLLAITHLSLIDEVNSYAVLKLAMDDLKIDQLEAKYKT